MHAANDSAGAAALATGVASTAQTAVRTNKRSEFMSGSLRPIDREVQGSDADRGRHPQSDERRFRCRETPPAPPDARPECRDPPRAPKLGAPIAARRRLDCPFLRRAAFAA